jgi:Domain of unknown function (DUF6894)
MTPYFFTLHTRDAAVFDPNGIELPDEGSARRYAEMVARELMANREPHTRSWRLDVHDSHGRRCFRLVFATVDHTLSHLRPDLRGSLENCCASAASFAEAIRAIKLTLLEVKATLARAEGALHLAAVNGVALRSPTRPAAVLPRNGANWNRMQAS